MIDETGKKVWEETFDLWGKPHDRLETRVVGGAILTNVKPREETTHPEISQPFRFPGQYHDEETGLYYNRYRYYMPGDGMYTQRDPIGLAGGNPTVYGYVFDTLKEVDPFGLNCKARFSGKRGMEKARHDIERNGFKILREEVTMKVNGSRIRADFVAKDGHGNFHVFEAKHGLGSKLTTNQDLSSVLNMSANSNTVSGIGGGIIKTSNGTSGTFILATGNKKYTSVFGPRGTVIDAIFHVLRY